MKRTLGPDEGCRAVDVVGGAVPISVEEFARRAYRYALNPLANPLKEMLDAFHGDVAATPPMLGIFSDIPWHQLRESEVQSWAKAGFSWIVADGEHSQNEGRYGREQMAMLLRNGITPVQRLHREARSEHGDALTMGARATMFPYGVNVQEAKDYLKCVEYPQEGAATPLCRGGFPLRRGDRELLFTPAEIRAPEAETQGWVQFETMEYIRDREIRDSVLDVMKAQGPNRACGFVGPFDAVMRGGVSPDLDAAIDDLISEAAGKGIYMGRVCGSGSCSEPEQIEESILRALRAGCRLISVHYLTADLPYHGAKAVASPFFKAAARWEAEVTAGEVGKKEIMLAPF